jgi:hypothetical protein
MCLWNWFYSVVITLIKLWQRRLNTHSLSLSCAHAHTHTHTLPENNWTFTVCLLHTFSISHNQGHVFFWIISIGWAHGNTFLNVKGFFVCVCSVWIIVEWFYAIYINGCSLVAGQGIPQRMCSSMIFVLYLIKVRICLLCSIIHRQNVFRIGWCTWGCTNVCKRK